MSHQEVGIAPTLGAIEQPDGTYTLRVWSPGAAEVVAMLRSGIETRTEAMTLETGGYWTLAGVRARPGSRYGFLLDGAGPFPDPCSRRQPDGVHGLSALESRAFPWTDAAWQRPPPSELVVYELHIGAATAAGTFIAAAGLLRGLREIGVTAVELLPVASFPGRWGWGYDGVALFAPFEGYGGPEGLRSFVDAAHREGLAVILDVVYNHFGPDGDYTGRYSSFYRHPERETAWGAALNFDGPGAPEVRRFVFENAQMWLSEYHVDGLRLDATHAILDASTPHLLAELSSRVRTFDGCRPYLIAETHENDRRYLEPVAAGGYGFDAVWADDFHHAARTLLQGDFEGHFAGFDGSMETLARVLQEGWFYSGQFDAGFGDCRGTDPSGLPWNSFVFCLENHDQAGNRAFGERLAQTANESELRALTMLLLVHPATPLLFMGQDRSDPPPFPFFSDHEPELGELVRAGRRREFGRFQAFSDERMQTVIPDPQDPATFEMAKPRPALPRDALVRAYLAALLRFRREDPVLRDFRAGRLPLAVAQPTRDSLLVVLESPAGRRALALNLSREPALFRLRASVSEIYMSSDEGRFGGLGRPPRLDGGRVLAPPRTALLLGCD